MPIIIDGEEFYTKKEIMKLFNISADTVIRWQKNGALPYIEINKKRRLVNAKILKNCLLKESK